MIKGFDAIKDMLGPSTEWFRLEDGQSKLIRFALPKNEMIGVYEHTENIMGKFKNFRCVGAETCVLCKSGSRPLFRVLTVVIDREEDKVKVFKMSKKVARQLLALEEEYGDFTARDFKITRTGKDANTQYIFFPRDPSAINLEKYQMPNLEDLVKPVSQETILAMISGGSTAGGLKTPSEDDEDLPF